MGILLGLSSGWHSGAITFFSSRTSAIEIGCGSGLRIVFKIGLVIKSPVEKSLASWPVRFPYKASRWLSIGKKSAYHSLTRSLVTNSEQDTIPDDPWLRV
jgi:hypothetical protein